MVDIYMWFMVFFNLISKSITSLCIRELKNRTYNGDYILYHYCQVKPDISDMKHIPHITTKL